jgi:hypothetical protein
VAMVRGIFVVDAEKVNLPNHLVPGAIHKG